MRSFKITKLNVTPAASARLKDLGLSPGDLDIVICFGRKVSYEDLTFYIFDQKQLAITEQQFRYLVRTILIISAGRIIDVCRDSQSSLEPVKSTESLDADENR